MSQPSLDLDYDDGADPTYTVGELAEAIKQQLRRAFPDGAWVRGEIQGLQQRANGHVYFNLTERGDKFLHDKGFEGLPHDGTHDAHQVLTDLVDAQMQLGSRKGGAIARATAARSST